MRLLLRWLAIGIVLVTLLAFLAPHVSPAVFWPLTAAGLLAPWLLLATLLLFILLAYRRRRIAWLLLLCLMVGWPIVQRLVAWASEESTNAEVEVRVQTFNCHVFRPAGTMNFLDPADIAAELEEEKADVLLFQEFPHGTAGDTYAAAIRSATALPYSYLPERSGLAFFSRYALEPGEYKFYANRVNGFAYVDLTTPAGTWRVFNVHLQSNAVTGLSEQVVNDGDLKERETWTTIRGMFSRYGRSAAMRAEQVLTLSQWIRRSPHPVVVGGDFNDVPASYTYQTLKDSGLRDAFLRAGHGLGATYTGRIPGLRIDYLWTSPQLGVASVANPTVHYSDHRPVQAVITADSLRVD